MNRRQRFSAARRALLIVLIGGLLFLIAGSVYAGHCPPSDPDRKDCAAAAETAQNPLVAFFGALIGAFLGLFASPVYAEETPAPKPTVAPSPSPSPRPQFVTDAPYNHDIKTSAGDIWHANMTEKFLQDYDDYLVRSGLEGKLEKVGPATNTYNCHGFTFCGGKAWLVDPKQIEDIIHDNGYKEVTRRKAKGDVAVYRVEKTETDEKGKVTTVKEITHTGIVWEVDANGNPTVIRSKWGPMSLYEHAPNDVRPDWGKDPTYYHASRAGGNTLKVK